MQSPNPTSFSLATRLPGQTEQQRLEQWLSHLETIKAIDVEDTTLGLVSVGNEHRIIPDHPEVPDRFDTKKTFSWLQQLEMAEKLAAASANLSYTSSANLSPQLSAPFLPPLPPFTSNSTASSTSGNSPMSICPSLL